jgi:hypothetical protein
VVLSRSALPEYMVVVHPCGVLHSRVRIAQASVLGYYPVALAYDVRHCLVQTPLVSVLGYYLVEVSS